MSVVSPVTGRLRSVAPRKADLRADLVAGLPNAISSVPDGMASGVLAGVSPVSGLYASAIGPLVGGFGSSTQLMVITTTSAASLAAGSAVAVVDEAHRAGALALLTLLAGGFMVVAGVLPARPLHPVRVPLGDARLPHRRRGEHHLRPARPT